MNANLALSPMVEAEHPSPLEVTAACLNFLQATVIMDGPEHWHDWFRQVYTGGGTREPAGRAMRWLGPFTWNRLYDPPLVSGPRVLHGLGWEAEVAFEPVGEYITDVNGWTAILWGVEHGWDDDDIALAVRSGLHWREMRPEGLTAKQRQSLPTVAAMRVRERRAP